MATNRNTISWAVKAKCHDCSGHYIDGKVDCGVTTCPLYKWMPYATRKPDLGWTTYSPLRVGNSVREPISLSAERKLELITRLRKNREKAKKAKEEEK